MFKLRLCSQKNTPQGCLHYHLDQCAGTCLSSFDKENYLQRIELVKTLLKKDYKTFYQTIKDDIEQSNKDLNFERSQRLYHYLDDFEKLTGMLSSGFAEKKYIKDIADIVTPFNRNIEQTHKGINDLKKILGTSLPIDTIDCFDISHFQSRYIVGSCVRFHYGIPDKQKFRKFKVKSLATQNDYQALQEIVTRRYKNLDDLPDLILIDGGKGQLSSIKKLDLPTLCISLAKKEETIYSMHRHIEYKLDMHTDLGQLLTRIRDYAHHFAISYHKVLRKKQLHH
jgi:excinuclease ABC subunit C